MSKMFSVYGIGQALIPVLPPPLPFENAPTDNQTNYEIGQLVFTPPRSPTAFYLYGGGGNWVEIATASGAVLSVLGTANQITVTTVSGVATVSLPNAITAPGSLTTTTTLAAGTSMSSGTSITAGTTLTATLGNITATNGNLSLAHTGNKILIHATTAASDSIGTATLGAGGTVTVSTTAVTASSLIFLSYNNCTSSLAASLDYANVVAGVSFDIVSQDATDATSTVNYWIIN